MQKRTREIIALVLLVVLGIGGISAMAWYILVGHNWNAAATSIDDRIGNMDGYTVMLFEGAVPSLADQQELSLAQPMLEQENFPRLVSDEGSSSLKPLTVQEAFDSYVEKGAQVVRVRCDAPALYEDPVIIPRNGRRIAVFAVSGPRADLASKNIVKGLADKDIDFTICMVDDLDLAKQGLDDIDLAVCSDFDAAGLEGDYFEYTYVMGVPYEGSVGAVIMSPSGFLTSKMIDVS